MDRSCLPGVGSRWRELATSALLDLHTLTLPNGALVAGASRHWRYVWPRDVSVGAAALARSGHPDDALRVLDFVVARQRANGLFEARYLPDRAGVPDDRGVQLDGTGWMLWGLDAVVDTAPSGARPVLIRRRMHLLDRSTVAIERLTGEGRRLPPPSSDYWELHERKVTLGTVAPLLAGLWAAQRMYWTVGESHRARQVLAAYENLRRTVDATFGSTGHQRYRRGGGVDAAVTMMLPPFQPAADPGVLDALSRAPGPMARPAGGVSPGERWRDDGVSWTPETAMFALADAATGRRAEAQRWLSWIDAHRTPLGAIPEKVLDDGSPAAVAPLAWSAALVLLAVQELEPPDCGAFDRDPGPHARRPRAGRG